MANRSTVAEHLIEMLSNIIILTMDEVHLHLSGSINKLYFQYWAEENLQQLTQWPLHSAHVTVWCGVANLGVIGPYFVDDKNGCAVSHICLLCSDVMDLPHTTLSRIRIEFSTK
jgi:hypothetical protein